MNEKATNEAMCFKEVIELMIFCKQIQERSALDFTKLNFAFNIPYSVGKKTLGLQTKMNGEVLKEINFIEKSFLPLEALGICGTALHFIDLKG